MKTKFIFLLTLIVILSCEKETTEEEATATITITSPIVNDTISYLGAVNFAGTVIGSGSMHGYTITFTNLTTGSIIHTENYNSHSSTYSFNTEWTNDVSDTSFVKLNIDVIKDHEGNHEIKSINVVCLPL